MVVGYSRCKPIEDFLKLKTENTALQIILNVFTSSYLILTVSFNQQKHVTKLKWDPLTKMNHSKL
jgi:hypothetical protein